jgi:hypothetical protein
MRLNTKVTFAMRDLDRLRCIQAVVDGDLRPIRAAVDINILCRLFQHHCRQGACFKVQIIIPEPKAVFLLLSIHR